jgi:glycosyltransferase involved in cell wall biosynthesis
MTSAGQISPAARVRTAPSERHDRPRLLFIVQTLPFPPDGGVHIRTFHVMRLLSQLFDITALCFFRRAERPRPEDIAASLDGLRPYAHVEAFPIPQEHDRSRFVWDHLRSVATRRPYTWYAYSSNEVRARVRALVTGGRFDLAHIDSLDLACYLPELRGIPTVCAHHNVESSLLRRRAAAEPGVRGAYLAHQARLLERCERRWSGGLAMNVAVSPHDQKELQRLAPDARFIQVPNGVDVENFRPVRGRETGIVSVGGINWFPNRDALSFFCDDILPRVRKVSPDVTMSWIGRAEDDERAHYRGRHGVMLTGYVDDVRTPVHNAACFVVPLRVGGGTRLKILDAWAMGKAIVSTSVGCEGLDAVDGRNILIRDTPDGFADAVTQVLADPALRSRLGCAGRDTVERIYSWEVIGRDMLAQYAALLSRAPARDAS